MELKIVPMETPMDQENYKRAKEQVKEIRGFYSHLMVFVLVNLFFLYINLKHSPEHLWFFWPTVGWGIGVFFHGIRVFNHHPFFGKGWEERKIRQFMEEEQRRRKKYE